MTIILEILDDWKILNYSLFEHIKKTMISVVSKVGTKEFTGFAYKIINRLKE